MAQCRHATEFNSVDVSSKKCFPLELDKTTTVVIPTKDFNGTRGRCRIIRSVYHTDPVVCFSLVQTMDGSI
jgi:hypothetical protein